MTFEQRLNLYIFKIHPSARKVNSSFIYLAGGVYFRQNDCLWCKDTNKGFRLLV